jgi:hypothetical protein
MGGGGKGGSQQTSTQIPSWVQGPATRNLARAEQAQKIGYQPYFGPDIAAFNPTQQAAFNANIGAAEAFGLVPQGSLTAMQGMAPEPQTFAGGIQGYSSAPLYEQALAEYQSRMPGQAAQYNKLFVDPYNVDGSAGYANPVSENTSQYTPVGTIASLKAGGSGAIWDPFTGALAGNSPIPQGWQLIGDNLVYKTEEHGMAADFNNGQWFQPTKGNPKY